MVQIMMVQPIIVSDLPDSGYGTKVKISASLEQQVFLKAPSLGN